MKKKDKADTSWESAHGWYDQIVGEKGHEYHKTVILPKLLKQMELTPKSSLLDVGCGQGILEKVIPKQSYYQGLDSSLSFIKKAKQSASPHHHFSHQDATENYQLERTFTHSTMILSMQNMQDPKAAFCNISKHLAPKGKLFLILNHPCFRIPRQSSWGIDEAKKLQYRRVDSYMSDMKIPIQVHPSKKNTQALMSFHYSLSQISTFLSEAGLLIEKIEEWCSNKTSSGGKAKMENRARKEFPLFMAITAIKN